MNNETGGLAFPSHGSMGEIVSEGMTLRDYFAAKAMQMKFGESNRSMPLDMMAKVCYEMADAMLETRK